MKDNLISIILPVYNVEKYIAQSLNSILVQTYDNIELIIIDDCGTDDSINIVERILSEYHGNKDVKIIRNGKNNGIAAARNCGITAARGNFIFFIDSDDFLEEDNAIKKMATRQSETDADVVTANSIMFDDITGKIYTTVDKDYKDAFYANTGSKPDRRMGNVVWNKLIRKSFIVENELIFDEGMLFEDVAWVFKLTCSSPKLSTMSDHTYRYRYRTNSIMTTLTQRHIISRALLPIVCNNWLLKHPTSKKIFAATTIEDLKQGCFAALQQTGNMNFIKPIYNIYKNYIPNVKHGKMSIKEFIKLSILRLPDSIYLKLTLYKLNKRSKTIRQSSDLRLDDSFISYIIKTARIQ